MTPDALCAISGSLPPRYRRRVMRLVTQLGIVGVKTVDDLKRVASENELIRNEVDQVRRLVVDEGDGGHPAACL
jgi:hypothetical protein